MNHFPKSHVESNHISIALYAEPWRGLVRQEGPIPRTVVSWSLMGTPIAYLGFEGAAPDEDGSRDLLTALVVGRKDRTAVRL